MGARWNRSWSMIRQCWSVLKEHPTLMVFPVLSGVCTIVALLLILGPVTLFAGKHGNDTASTSGTPTTMAIATPSAAADATSQRNSANTLAADAANPATPGAVAGSTVNTAAADATAVGAPTPYPAAARSAAGAHGGVGGIGFWLAIAVCTYIATFFSLFFNVALVSCARQAFRGEPTSVGAGVSAAFSRIAVIAAWALVATIVGMIIRAIERRGGSFGGAIVARMLGAAWAVATFFVVPILAFEGAGPVTASKRSLSLVRSRWSDAMIGEATLGFAFMICGYLPSIVMIMLGIFALGSAGAAASVMLIVLGTLMMVVTMSVQATMDGLYRAALYEYASGGTAPSGFSGGPFGAARPDAIPVATADTAAAPYAQLPPPPMAPPQQLTPEQQYYAQLQAQQQVMQSPPPPTPPPHLAPEQPRDQWYEGPAA